MIIEETGFKSITIFVIRGVVLGEDNSNRLLEVLPII